ncbi:CgeB family protein [Flavitalea flava]
MRVLYIGQYGEGSTSRMRGENLKGLLNPGSFEIIDINDPIFRTNPLFRSIGWRFKKGPMIPLVNRYIERNMDGHYDLVWVDKGIFNYPALVREMKAGIKVHYTPDTAIVYNKSRLFSGSIPFYDYCITTKSFELDAYRQQGAKQTLYCTQGYDTRIHKPYHGFEEKEGVVFIGLHEPEKEYVIARLLEKKINITLAGENWEKFARKHRNKNYLSYVGKGVFGEAYGRLLSKNKIGLGLLSRFFPEKHTTRTIEIPACCTALICERNEDTRSIFTEEEAMLYDNTDELLEKAARALRDQKYLLEITQKGFDRIVRGGYDYKSILKNLLEKMELI